VSVKPLADFDKASMVLGSAVFLQANSMVV
jgi:hypothetical protein